MVLADLVVELGRAVELGDLVLADAVKQLLAAAGDVLDADAASGWVRHWRPALADRVPACLLVEVVDG